MLWIVDIGTTACMQVSSVTLPASGVQSVRVTAPSAIFTWNINASVLNSSAILSIDTNNSPATNISLFTGSNGVDSPLYLSPYPYPLNSQYECATYTLSSGQSYSFVYTYLNNDWIMRRNNSTGNWVAVAYLYSGGKNGDSLGFSNSTLATFQYGNGSVTAPWSFLTQNDSYYNTAANILLFPNP